MMMCFTQDYATFLKVYSTFQKINAGQQQFQQLKDEIQAGTRSRTRQIQRDTDGHQDVGKSV